MVRVSLDQASARSACMAGLAPCVTRRRRRMAPSRKTDLSKTTLPTLRASLKRGHPRRSRSRKTPSLRARQTTPVCSRRPRLRTYRSMSQNIAAPTVMRRPVLIVAPAVKRLSLRQRTPRCLIRFRPLRLQRNSPKRCTAQCIVLLLRLAAMAAG